MWRNDQTLAGIGSGIDSFPNSPAFESFMNRYGLFVMLGIFILMMTAFFGAMIWSFTRNARKRRAKETLAKHLEFDYWPSVGDGLIRQFDKIRLFTENDKVSGHTCLCRESSEPRIYIFDFVRYTPPNEHGFRDGIPQTVVLLVSQEERFPVAFQVETELMAWRVREMLGKKEIDFAEDPEFSRRYFVTSDDEEGLRRLLQPAFFREMKRRGKRYFAVEAGGNAMVAYYPCRTVPARRIIPFLEDALRIYRTFG